MQGLRHDAPVCGLTILLDRLALGERGRGIFFMQADSISADDVNIMARHGRGVIGAALTASRALAIGLSPLTNTHVREGATRYMASVEAAACTETGISAAERALTLRVLAGIGTHPDDLVAPGHIMPAIVAESEGADTTLEALGFHYAARSNNALAIAWCDILDNDGNVADSAHCIALASYLAVPLLLRVGNTAIAADVVERSRLARDIDVKSGGLDLGQFA